MTAQVQEARAAGADVLFVYGIGPELAALANSMERIGWKVDLLGGWSISMEAFIKNAGKNGNGATAPLTFIEGDVSNPRQKTFVDTYHVKYNQNPIAVAVAAHQPVEPLLSPRISPRRREGLSHAIKNGLALPAGQHPEILRHKGHRLTDAQIRRYRELEKCRDAHAHKLGIDPTLIASRATLGDLARDWERHAPELMNWQRELMK